MTNYVHHLAFQVLRVYAISGRTWQLAVLVGTFNVFPQFLAIVSEFLVLCLFRSIYSKTLYPVYMVQQFMGP